MLGGDFTFLEILFAIDRRIQVLLDPLILWTFLFVDGGGRRYVHNKWPNPAVFNPGFVLRDHSWLCLLFKP